jgi:hypothetical protein
MVVGKARPEYAAYIERRYSCVQFHANVPTILPYLQQARIGLIAETVGGGFKLKTLDYAFGHLPIAALKQALGGVDLDSGVDAIVESSLPALMASIVTRMDDFDFLNAAAARTYARFEKCYRWPERGQTLLSVLGSL